MLLYRHTGAWVEFIVTYASVTSQQLNISGGVWNNHSLQLTMQRPPPPLHQLIPHPHSWPNTAASCQSQCRHSNRPAYSLSLRHRKRMVVCACEQLTALPITHTSPFPCPYWPPILFPVRVMGTLVLLSQSWTHHDWHEGKRGQGGNSGYYPQLIWKKKNVLNDHRKQWLERLRNSCAS